MANLTVKEQGELTTAVGKLVLQGDLSSLSESDRVTFYHAYCESMGLNPVTQPLAYIKVRGGATKLYPKKEAAEQLRMMHGVNFPQGPNLSFQDDMVIVTQVATCGDRQDADVGIVCLAKLQGEDRANAIMKAITKAKRRVTLSILGLGFFNQYEDSKATTVVSAETEQPKALKSADPKPISESRRRRLFAIAGEHGLSTEALKLWLYEQFNLESTKDIPEDIYDAICDAITPEMTAEWNARLVEGAIA